jgi:hypothetical protein
MGVESIFGKVASLRGDSSENRVRRALVQLKDLGQIDGIRRSRELEREGIDFLVIIGTKHYKIQVKSSKSGIEKEKKEHFQRYTHHQDVIFVVPSKDQDTQRIGQNILQRIEVFEQKMHER